jgi:hypothetical protein
VSRLSKVVGYAPQGLNKAFREKMVRTRNYYTHFSPIRGRIFNSTEMYWASQRLAAMIIILALDKAGVESAVIRKQLAGRDDIARILRKTGAPF